MNAIIQALQILAARWPDIKAAGATLDVDAIMEEIAREERSTA